MSHDKPTVHNVTDSYATWLEVMTADYGITTDITMLDKPHALLAACAAAALVQSLTAAPKPAKLTDCTSGLQAQG